MAKTPGEYVARARKTMEKGMQRNDLDTVHQACGFYDAANKRPGDWTRYANEADAAYRAMTHMSLAAAQAMTSAYAGEQNPEFLNNARIHAARAMQWARQLKDTDLQKQAQIWTDTLREYQ